MVYVNLTMLCLSSDKLIPIACCCCLLFQIKENSRATEHDPAELKKQETAYPTPSTSKHWHSVSAENCHLLENIFDSAGKYTFCARCVYCTVGVDGERLTRLRELKRSQHLYSTVEMSKEEVIADVVSICKECAVCPEKDFDTWWACIEMDEMVEVRQALVMHTLAGCVSDNAEAVTRSNS